MLLWYIYLFILIFLPLQVRLYVSLISSASLEWDLAFRMCFSVGSLAKAFSSTVFMSSPTATMEMVLPACFRRTASGMVLSMLMLEPPNYKNNISALGLNDKINTLFCEENHFRPILL